MSVAGQRIFITLLLVDYVNPSFLVDIDHGLKSVFVSVEGEVRSILGRKVLLKSGFVGHGATKDGRASPILFGIKLFAIFVSRGEPKCAHTTMSSLEVENKTNVIDYLDWVVFHMDKSDRVFIKVN